MIQNRGRRSWGLVVGIALGLVTAVAAALVANHVLAHGTTQNPISRSLQCYNEGPENLTSAACQAAVLLGSGTNQFYTWNQVSQGGADGNHQAFVPDGQLCSGGNEGYAGLDLARDDWVAQTLPGDGSSYQFLYKASAPHSSEYFKYYVTKDGYDPLEPLKWSDLELFCEITGTPPLVDGNYEMDCNLPANKSGRHIIYNIWQRNDSPEAFYACSDVIFECDSCATGTVSGTATLQGASDHSGIVVTAWDGAAEVDSTTTDASGSYSLSLPAGTYTIKVEGTSALDTEENGVMVTAGSTTTLAAVVLPAGDLNDDDTINIYDLSIIGAQYGKSSGDAGWDARADLTQEGTVDILDLSIIGSNYDKSSPGNWP